MDQVKLVDRADLFKDSFKNPFITNFSNQHQNIKHIVNKHWHILGNDRILNTFLPAKPQVVFRGAPSLRDKLVTNILNPPTTKPIFFTDFTGYYKCRKCQVCSLNRCRTRRTTGFTSSCTSRAFKIEPFITCSTVGVVYLLQCPCGLQYVGRTKCPLQVHLNKHINNIQKGFTKHCI